MKTKKLNTKGKLQDQEDDNPDKRTIRGMGRINLSNLNFCRDNFIGFISSRRILFERFNMTIKNKEQGSQFWFWVGTIFGMLLMVFIKWLISLS